MIEWVAQSARGRPEAPALITPARSLTYRELDDEVGRAAAWLAAIGVRQGTRVGVYAASRAETVVVFHAIMRTGAVLVPLNLRLRHAELQQQLRQIELVISDRESEFDKPVYSLHDYANFQGKPLPARIFAMDETHALMFTSGTSGTPKAAELTYGNQFFNAMASALRLGVSPDDRWLCCMPLYHVGGLSILLRCALYGTCVVLHDGFDVDRVNYALDHDEVTHISLVPTMLYRLIPTRTTPPPRLKMCLIGGAAATPALVLAAQAAGFPIVTTYGMTEAASQIATQTPAQTNRKPGSVGKAVPFTELWIEGTDGQTLPAGEIGEIVVRGATVMRRYLGDLPATTQTLRGGALHTGDLGYLDSDGDLWLVQRRSDLIVSGGENVYPAEVEAALRTHPAVRDACVVGVHHAEWGQQVAALIAGDQAISAGEIVAYLRNMLAGYKIPRTVHFVDALPLTGSGKVDRRAAQTLLTGNEIGRL